MTQQQKNNIVLAFDIERSGSTLEHDTIAIGASVVDWNFKELDNLCLLGYIPEETIFEEKTWKEFWCNHQDILNTLIYKGSKTKKEREKEMILEFQAFRKKWENCANKNNLKLELCTDNNVFDGGFTNNMIFEHTSYLPIPYNTSHLYKSFWETHSEQRGLLMGVDKTFKEDWGFTKRIAELYNVPEMKKTHDHNPANDAYTVAFEQQILLNIRDDKIKLRK